MKPLLIVFAFLLSGLATAGTYENLEEALIRNDSAAVIKFLDRGVDVNTVDRDGDSLLTQAVRRDLPELFEYLMQKRARLNTRNRNGETALSIAAFTGKLNFVKPLVEGGAEINLYGWSPLAYAAFNGHHDVVDYLLKHGAKVDAKTENGSTAIFYAARFGHVSVVKLLLEHKADLDILNENGETVVDGAMKGGNTEIEALLREAGGRSGKSVEVDLSK